MGLAAAVGGRARIEDPEPAVSGGDVQRGGRHAHVAGAGKALAFHLEPVAAMLLGMLTGIGGGMIRDVLLSEIPVVFTAELYAVAALAGAAVVVIGNALHLPSPAAGSAGMILCFGLRVMAIQRGWKLPVARQPD